MLCRMTFFQKRARTKLFIPAFLVVTGAALLHAQRPQGGPVGDLVVDFVALDASGQPVAGLQPADVAIKIAGKVRTVTALELKRFDAGGARTGRCRSGGGRPQRLRRRLRQMRAGAPPRRRRPAAR